MSAILEFIRDYIDRPENRSEIERFCADCESELAGHPDLEMTYRLVSDDLDLPSSASALKSLWVFAFRPNGESDIHKHSNSTQYTLTRSGLGTMRIGNPETRRADHLLHPFATESDLAIIPPGTYHHAVASDEGWQVVSFHTVLSSQLLDEPFDGIPHPYVTSEGVNIT